MRAIQWVMMSAAMNGLAISGASYGVDIGSGAAIVLLSYVALYRGQQVYVLEVGGDSVS